MQLAIKGDDGGNERIGEMHHRRGTHHQNNPTQLARLHIPYPLLKPPCDQAHSHTTGDLPHDSCLNCSEWSPRMGGGKRSGRRDPGDMHRIGMDGSTGKVQ